MQKGRHRKSAVLALSVGTMLMGGSLGIAGGVVNAAVSQPPVVDGKVQVSNVGQLEYIDTHQTATISGGVSTTYLDATIDLASTTYNLTGDSWVPLGTSADPFSGTFDGQGAVISGLTLSLATGGASAAGFFGVESGTIENVYLEDETLKGQISGAAYVGGLVGDQEGGSISNIGISHAVASALVTGSPVDWGGLVGRQSAGTITDVTGTNLSITANKTGPYSTTSGGIGGLVGYQSGGSIEDAKADESIVSTGSGRTLVGGLLGQQHGGEVIDATASGKVSVTSGQIAGGLVALQSGSGTIDAGDAYGVVGGGSINGGLVGAQFSGGVVNNSWATALVSASSSINDSSEIANGGLIGEQFDGGLVKNSYAEGQVTGHGGFLLDGGLVGAMMGGGNPEVIDSFATGPVTSGTVNGGIVGEMMGGVISGAYALGNVTGAPTTASYDNGGIAGYLESGTVEDSYAMGNVSADGEWAAGGIIGEDYYGTVQDVYETGMVTSATHMGGILGVLPAGATGTITDSVYLASAATSAVGSGGLGTGGSATSATEASMQTPFASSSSPFYPWMTSATWSQMSSLSSGLPIIADDMVTTLNANSMSVTTAGSSVSLGVDAEYFVRQSGGIAGVTVSGVPITLGATAGTWSQSTVTSSASSPTVVDWTAPATTGVVSLTAAEDGAFTSMVDLMVDAASPSPSTGTTSTSTWSPPTFVPESVTVDGINGVVIANDGHNPPSAVANGSTVGFVEERAAVLAGASFNGEGLYSSYLSAILSGQGVGNQQHVSAVQQGQYAALYQKLGIIPTWQGTIVTPMTGLAALQKAGAPSLARENYLVQIDGFSWALAQTMVTYANSSMLP